MEHCTVQCTTNVHNNLSWAVYTCLPPVEDGRDGAGQGVQPDEDHGEEGGQRGRQRKLPVLTQVKGYILFNVYVKNWHFYGF